MKLIPRSLRIAQPYRGRTMRHFCDQLPFVRRLRLAQEERRRRWVAAAGRKALANGAPEGRRYLTALPHPFCGIGHSASEWNTAYQWAPLLDLEYVNTPLQEPWASFLGFGRETSTYWELTRRARPIVLRLPYAGWSRGADALAVVRPVVEAIRSPRPILFVLADGQNCYDQTANSRQLRADFQRYGRWHHLPEHREPGRLNVAVHIRRGDVANMKAQDNGDWRERFVEPEWFSQVMGRLVGERGAERPLFHLYSQGDPAAFGSMCRGFDVRMHLDACEQETLLNMVRADVLVMSPSGFSYLAAILSDGRKVARAPWWHHLPDTDGWTLLAA